MNDPIAITLRAIIVLFAAAGLLFVSGATLAGVLPGFAAAAYALIFMSVGAVGVFGR